MRRTLLLSALLLSTPFALTGTLPAQTSAPGTALAFSKARALYYTPADAGLQGFHCEVGFDWKSFMEEAANAAVPASDARLQYLQSIQLTVDDDLHTGGELHWVAPAPPPENAEASVGQIRSGLQQLWSGFFQAWNGFPTGDMVSLDPKATVEHDPAGYRVRVLTGSGLASELYDDKLLLKSVHVTTPTLDSLVEPTFTATPQGLVVSSIRSSYKQPPTAAATEVNTTIRYAQVASFQLPSQVTITVGPTNFDFHLANCTVRSQITSK